MQKSLKLTIPLVTQILYSFVYYRFVFFFSLIYRACEVEDAIALISLYFQTAASHIGYVDKAIA